MKFIYHASFGGQTPDRQQRRKLRRAGTVMIEAPHISFIVNAAYEAINGNMRTVTFKIGQAIVHPDDQFDRSVGIAIAEKNAKMEDFTVIGLETTYLDNDAQNPIVRLYLADANGIGGLKVDFNVQTGYYRVKYFSLTDGRNHGSN
jgi:hypothetical protein